MQHDSEVKKRGGMGKGGQEGRRRRRSGRGGGGRTEADEGKWQIGLHMCKTKMYRLVFAFVFTQIRIINDH